MKRKLALLYHEVVDDYTESGFQNNDNLAYMHKTEVFIKHIEIFKNYIEHNNPSIVDEYIFTFDDGGVSNLRSASILENNDLLGTFFITTKRIGTHGFLNEENILELHEKGHFIGSHSHTHPMIFRSLNYSEMLEEWKISKHILEDITGKEILSCSIPGGDADQKTYESAIESGFKYIFDSEPIILTRNLKSAEIIGRISIKAKLSENQFLNILELKKISALQRNRKIKSTIKKIIFPIHQYMQNKKNEK